MALHLLTNINMSNKRGGLFFGIIAGTLLGILFAPKKGKELRKELKQEVDKGGLGTETLKKNFAEMGQDIAGTAEEIYSQPEVQKNVNKGKKQLGKILTNADAKMQEFGEKYHDLGQEKIYEANEKVRHGIKMMKKKIMSDDGIMKRRVSKIVNKVKKAATAAKKRTRKIKIKKHSS